MMVTLMIVFMILAVVVFGVLFTLWISRFNRTGSAKFNFLTYYPFELNGFRRKSSSRFIDLGLLTLGSILLIMPMVFFVIEHQYASSYILLVVFVLEVICFLILLFTKLSNYRPHVLFAVIFGALEILSSFLMITFFCSTNPDFNGYIVNNPVLVYIVLGVIILQLMFQIILFCNPTHKGWAQMVKIDAETFSRPKYCYLAMLEWGTFLNLLLNYLIIILVSCF